MRVNQYFILITVFSSILCHLSASSGNMHADSLQWKVLQSQIETYQQKNTDSVLFFLHQADSFAKQNDLNDKDRLFLQNARAKYYAEKPSTDSAIIYLRKALMTSESVGDQDLIYNQMTKLAGAYNNIYLADSALKYYREALVYYREMNDSLPKASILSGIATALIESGHNKEALEKLYDAENIYKTTTKFRELGVIYDNIALINARLGYEKNTIKYGKKAIALYQKARDTLMLADAYANLGVSYKNLNQHDTALFYYEKSNALAREINSTWLLAKNLHNIGVVYDVTGSPEKAAESFRASLEICRQENFLFGEFNNSINLGDFEMEKPDYPQAINYFKRAAEIGKQLHFDDLGVVYDKLHTAYAETGHDKQALLYVRKYMHFRDSALSAQKHQEIMELQTRYETQKKEAQILKLEKENQKEALLRAYLLLGFVGVVVIGLLLLLRSRRKHAEAKQNTLKLEKANEQKRSEMEKLRLEKKLQEHAAEKYRLDLKLKEQELVYRTLREAGLSHLMKKIEDKLSPYTYHFSRKKEQEKYKTTLQEITRETTNNPLADFEEMFLQMHDGFYEKLLEINPDLTRSELQMAALLRMNLPSKEIARLLNLALSTIDKRRHHIRQKISLSSDQSLTGFLIGL